MNERIKELAIRAELTVNTRGKIGPAGFGPVDDGYKKFAELIVKECANRATWAQDTGAKDIGGEVLKHFGVEE